MRDRNAYSSRKIDDIENVFDVRVIQPRSARWYRGFAIAQFASEPKYKVYGTDVMGRADEAFYDGSNQIECKDWIDKMHSWQKRRGNIMDRCGAIAVTTGSRCFKHGRTCPECSKVRCVLHAKCGHRPQSEVGRPRKDPNRPCGECKEVKTDEDYYWKAGSRSRFSKCKECLRKLRTPRI